MTLREKILALKPSLYSHELLTNKPRGTADGDGIHLGCPSRDTVVKAHTPGETSEVIYEWYSAADMRAAAEAVAPYDALIEEMVGALRLAEAALSDIGDADREPGDDVAWCEKRAAQAIPKSRAALQAAAALKESPKIQGGPDPRRDLNIPQPDRGLQWEQP